MKTSTFVFLGLLAALLLISYVAANDASQDQQKRNGENQVANDKHHDHDGYGYGYGGPGYGGGWGGSGWGGGGGGWGGGGWGGHCRYGCCGGGGGGWGPWGGGGCRCCYSAQEALAYMQNEARP